MFSYNMHNIYYRFQNQQIGSLCGTILCHIPNYYIKTNKLNILTKFV